jgi:hypothetical protein
VNSARVNGYQSVVAFGPVQGKHLPRYRIFDLDEQGVALAGILNGYDLVAQNLRLIKRPGSNRWAQQ